MAPIDTKAELSAVRALMKEHNVDVYVVPPGDSHASEYIAARDARRKFVSGFSGTAGHAVITKDAAVVSTDGRYFNQASQQLDGGWTLLKDGLPGVPSWQDWTAEQVKAGGTVAVDPELVTTAEAEDLQLKIEAEGGKLVALDKNLIDAVWSSEQPARPNEPVFSQSTKLSGKSVEEKLAWLRSDLAKRKAAGIVITMLDELAWLLNLRGSDVPNNPVFYAYAVITDKSAAIWVDKSRMDQESVASLTANSVEIKPYENFFSDVSGLDAGGKKYLISPTASWRVYLALNGSKLANTTSSPIAAAKAVKTAEELEGMRQCHVRDGAAIIEYLSWLENQLMVQKAEVTEFEGAQKLAGFRKQKELHVGNSFDTISSSGPNAAIMHYKPEKDKCLPIDPHAIYLCDSGAQYRDGTTDTTRTVHLGTPTKTEVEAYTRVLKALIGLHRAIFPKGTFGLGVDVFARQHLWEFGMNFMHGTGHGVGSFLNVHEGPISIGQKERAAKAVLEPGNVLSNEPGYYVDGSFGVRIEDIILVVPKSTKFEFGGNVWLGFENVTVVPYCRKLLDTSLLTGAELEWLNARNAHTAEKTRPLLEGNDVALAWLERETQPYA